MRHLHRAEYAHIAAAGKIETVAEYKLTFKLCTQTVTADSIEEQLGACQEVIDYFSPQLEMYAMGTRVLHDIQRQIERLQNRPSLYSDEL